MRRRSYIANTRQIGHKIVRILRTHSGYLSNYIFYFKDINGNSLTTYDELQIDDSSIELIYSYQNAPPTSLLIAYEGGLKIKIEYPSKPQLYIYKLSFQDKDIFFAFISSLTDKKMIAIFLQQGFEVYSESTSYIICH